MQKKQINFHDAVDDYMIAKKAAGCSDASLRLYQGIFRRAEKSLDGNMSLADMTPLHFQTMLVENDHLKKKTRRNICMALSSLFEYHKLQENVKVNVMRKFRWPVPDSELPDPLTETEIERVFLAIPQAMIYDSVTKKECKAPAAHIDRNLAITLILLDTGIRASELCGLQVRNVSHSSIKVMGKGSIERSLPISEMTHEALERYWLTERGCIPTEGSAFLNSLGKPMSPSVLSTVLNQLGNIAGVHLHPHRFRHTFAINFLRNRGNIYALQKIMGHSSLDMVKNYLKLTEIDVAESHRRSTPINRLAFDPFQDSIPLP